MFAALKRIFQRSAPRGSSPFTSSHSPERTAVQPSPAPEPSDISSAARPAGMPETMIRVPYSAIVKALPVELQGKVSPPSSAKFCLPGSTVMEQLAHGAVKVNFGELRKAAPVGVFRTTGDQDARDVELPLREILRQVKPEYYARRKQKRVQVSDEITDLFGRKGEMLADVRVLDRKEIHQSSPTASKPVTPATPAPAAEAVPAPIAASAPAPKEPTPPANSPIPFSGGGKIRFNHPPLAPAKPDQNTRGTLTETGQCHPAAAGNRAGSAVAGDSRPVDSI